MCNGFLEFIGEQVMQPLFGEISLTIDKILTSKLNRVIMIVCT